MMSQRTDWQHRGRGGHWHGYQRKSNDDNQGICYIIYIIHLLVDLQLITNQQESCF